MQQPLTCRMVWSSSFYSLLKKAALNFKKNPGGKILKKCGKVPEGPKIKKIRDFERD